jgi:site-specific DNA recombinase
VDPAQVYVDDGVSGALFGASRPGLAGLLAALAPRPAFGVLIMSEESRLGREQIETAYVLKRTTDAGVAVWFYMDDRQRTLDSPSDKVMLSLTAFASEMERDRARLRTHDALLQRAKHGHVTGGVVFGYRNVPILDGGRRRHVERVIEPREAAVVVCIFRLTVDGWGVKRIAAALNADSAPAPRPHRAGRPRGWAPSSVREVLHRDLYRGVLVWNRTARIIRQGARAQRERPAAEVVSVAVPELTIVDDALWTAAQARMAATAVVYRERTGGLAFGRPANGVESKYLLTGFGVCAGCGGSMATLKRAHGPRGHRRQVPFYGCMTRHLRGDAICANALEVRLDDAEEAVLAAVERDVLNVAVLETSLAKAMADLSGSPDEPDRRASSLRDELARLDAEVARLADAIARGGDLPALVGALQERERRRGQIRAALAEGSVIGCAVGVWISATPST